MMWASCLLVLWCLVSSVHGVVEEEELVVRREARKSIVSTEYGTIYAVDVGGEGTRNMYHLQFISMDPNSLFLPAILHADMIFYVHTGSGSLSYTEDGGDMKEVKLTRGDVYRVKSGSIFFMQSSLEPQRERLRINAIFSNAELRGKWNGAYSGIHALFQGFDKRILQAAFQVSEEVVEEIRNASRTPPIVHAEKTTKSESSFVKAILGIKSQVEEGNKKKKHTKTYNIFKEARDVDNCDGWSTMVTSKHLHTLKGSDIGVFMVNLSTGAMMGPHWNPIATEIGVVLEGRGMVRVVCSSNLTTRSECNNMRFVVEDGDVFVVPRFHPMAHMSFNNETLVFMGFSTSNTYNHPQFLAGEASVLHVLNKRILELTLNVNNTAISRLLAAQKGSIILDCISCAEEELEIGAREVEVRKQKKKEEEQQQRQEEEEKRRREKEEEERRREEEKRRQEEERRRSQEEVKRRYEEEEEQRRREEEERRRQKEEERKRKEKEAQQIRQEEEEERRREEKEERRRQEEEERRQYEEEEEQKRQEDKRRKEEEEERTRQEEEEERRQKKEEKERARHEEEEERRQQEEEERRQYQEEEERKRQEEKEEDKRRQEEEEERTRQEEEEGRRQKEEEKERTRQEEEEERRQKEEEKERARHDEEEEQRRHQEERRQYEEEEERKRQEEKEEDKRRQEEEEEQTRQEEEEERRRQKEEEKERARHEEEEEQRRHQEEERRHQEERGGQKEERRQEEEEEWTRQEEEEEQRQRKQAETEEEEMERERRRHEKGQEETEEEAARREEEERGRQWEQPNL